MQKSVVGRPAKKFIFNLNDISETIKSVKNICHNKDTKELVIELCHEMQKEFIERMETGTQTIPYPDTINETQNERIMTDVECQTDSDADGILQMISELEDEDDIFHIFSNIFTNISYKSASLWTLMSHEEQCEFYGLLGQNLNAYLYSFK